MRDRIYKKKEPKFRLVYSNPITFELSSSFLSSAFQDEKSTSPCVLLLLLLRSTSLICIHPNRIYPSNSSL
ncbi:unnamed protein product [Caenorhabditis nigoni]